MKYLALVLIITMVACSSFEKPIFKEVKNIRVTNLDLDSITVMADVHYFNPNLVGLQVKSSQMDVRVNDLQLSNINQDYSMKIEANSKFAVPVIISFPPKAVFGKDSGLISSVLQVLGNKKANLHYKGKFTLDIGGLEMDIPFEHTEEVPIKL